MLNFSDYALIIFDKDGTLIDFDHMWAGWMIEFARRVEVELQRPVAEPLYQAMGYDAATNHVLANSKLAITPMHLLRTLAVEVLHDLGLPPAVAAETVARAWYSPDPVALARPLTNLTQLFTQLRQHHLKIAVATTDDRAPTQATLTALGVTHFIDSMICADDGILVKPAPDMILTHCQRLGVAPARTLMVGDSLADMQMGRAAGAFNIGVLSGVSPAAALQSHADLIIPSIAALLPPG